MKITKEQLKQIIKEEIGMVMGEEMEGAVESDIRLALSSDEMSFEDLLAAVPDVQDSEELQDSLFYLLQKGDVQADEEIDMDKMENEVWTESDPEWSNVFFKSVPSLQEQDDANKEIDKAQVEAQKIAGKLASELEKVSEVSGLDVATLASLVSQFIDQEIK